MRALPALVLLLAAAGCHRPAAPETTGADPHAVDPAVAAALADPMMSDPQLTDASGAHLARSAATPEGAPVPLDLPGAPDPATLFDRRIEPTLGVLAGSAIGLRAGCGAIGYSATWAARLPRAVRLTSDAAVIEAAGEDRPGCSIRVVRFASTLRPAVLAERMAAQASHAGWAVTHRNGSALVAGDGRRALLRLSAQPAPGGSRADLVSFEAR